MSSIGKQLDGQTLFERQKDKLKNGIPAGPTVVTCGMEMAENAGAKTKRVHQLSVVFAPKGLFVHPKYRGGIIRVFFPNRYLSVFCHPSSVIFSHFSIASECSG